MPRSVLAALLAAAALGALGLAGLALRALGVEHTLGNVGLHVSFVAGAVWLLGGARRRDPRIRTVVFWWALASAIILGALLLPWDVARVALGRGRGAWVAELVVLAHGVVAYGLSRPSAKAWFRAAGRP